MKDRTFSPDAISVFDIPSSLDRRGDEGAKSIYLYTDRIILAVNAALVTRRPLLLRGESGSGKSSLACNVARCLGWRYLETVVTARTEAQEFLWRFDAVRRLADAQAVGNKLKSDEAYLVPGVFWWAFDPATAKVRGSVTNHDAGFPDAIPPSGNCVNELDFNKPAVVLIDEIDKADPDVPNGLLAPIGSMRFTVEGIERSFDVVAQNAPLIIISSNEERELPDAFLRRCLDLRIEPPDHDKLISIAAAHLPDTNPDLRHALAQKVIEARNREGKSTPPSTAEYLDALRACHAFNISPIDVSRIEDQEVKILLAMTLFKYRDRAQEEM